jgi:hypothetical protein
MYELSDYFTVMRDFVPRKGLGDLYGRPPAASLPESAAQDHFDSHVPTPAPVAREVLGAMRLSGYANGAQPHPTQPGASYTGVSLNHEPAVVHQAMTEAGYGRVATSTVAGKPMNYYEGGRSGFGVTAGSAPGTSNAYAYQPRPGLRPTDMAGEDTNLIGLH